MFRWASVGDRGGGCVIPFLLDTQEARGSSPLGPTHRTPSKQLGILFFLESSEMALRSAREPTREPIHENREDMSAWLRAIEYLKKAAVKPQLCSKMGSEPSEF